MRLRDDLQPRAPGYVGLWVATLGVAGAALGALAAPWTDLATAAWSGDTAAWTLTRMTLVPVVAGAITGALAGVALGQITAGAASFRLRSRILAIPAPRSFVRLPLALAGVIIAGAAALVALRGFGDDPGRLLVAAPLVAVVAGAAALAPAALHERFAARRAWRARVAPPRRDPDALPPEARTAVRERLNR